MPSLAAPWRGPQPDRSHRSAHRTRHGWPTSRMRHTRHVPPTMHPPAPRPCDSCPYRRDVPSGIWAREEYDKLRRFDAPTAEQPSRLFQCHQADADSATRRICAGWAGCHGDRLLGLRVALIEGRIDEATFAAAAGYESPVALFGSGSEAADHGQADIGWPGGEAGRLIGKITRTRSDLRTAPLPEGRPEQEKPT
ncbi:DUF6283 family protein [Streptomyces chartreusis]|uniref:DUF6283 family protein n=2 Tax=Streptomyces TaxID=1883 RepID=UPI003699E0EB